MEQLTESGLPDIYITDNYEASPAVTSRVHRFSVSTVDSSWTTHVPVFWIYLVRRLAALTNLTYNAEHRDGHHDCLIHNVLS